MAPTQLMALPAELTFSKDGEWLHDGEKFTHEGISRYFTKHLRYSAEHGCYVVEVQGKCVPVSVEDTAKVVLAVFCNRTPWQILLNTGDEEVFHPGTLCVSEENVFYCRRRDGELLRLTRYAAQGLFPAIETGESGGFVLKTPGGNTTIASCKRSEIEHTCHPK